MSFIIDAMSYCGNKIISFMCSCYEFLSGTSEKTNTIGKSAIQKAKEAANYAQTRDHVANKYGFTENAKNNYWITDFFNSISKSCFGSEKK